MNRLQELEQKYITEILHIFQSKYLTRYKHLQSYFKLTESPIEQLMMLGFIRIFEECIVTFANCIIPKFKYHVMKYYTNEENRKENDKFLFLTEFNRHDRVITIGMDEGMIYILVTQFKIGKYKVDFFINRTNFYL